jgi:predicted transcriptional regulator
MTFEYNEDDLRHAMFLWLRYTAIAMGETQVITSKDNELTKDPLGAVLTSYIYAAGGGPISIYELAKKNKMGSYRTIHRRVDELVERGFVEKQLDGVVITPSGTSIGRDFALKMLSLSDKVQLRKKKNEVVL